MTLEKLVTGRPIVPRRQSLRQLPRRPRKQVCAPPHRPLSNLFGKSCLVIGKLSDPQPGVSRWTVPPRSKNVSPEIIHVCSVADPDKRKFMPTGSELGETEMRSALTGKRIAYETAEASLEALLYVLATQYAAKMGDAVIFEGDVWCEDEEGSGSLCREAEEWVYWLGISRKGFGDVVGAMKGSIEEEGFTRLRLLPAHATDPKQRYHCGKAFRTAINLFWRIGPPIVDDFVSAFLCARQLMKAQGKSIEKGIVFASLFRETIQLTLCDKAFDERLS